MAKVDIGGPPEVEAVKWKERYEVNVKNNNHNSSNNNTSKMLKCGEAGRIIKNDKEHKDCSKEWT